MSIQLTLPIGSLDNYIRHVNEIPMLTAEEERELALRLRETGDIDAARRLVLSHLRFVVRVARGYSGYGLPQADLIQEGNIGLMKAVKRFDPNMGVRLVSFAVYWVCAEIREFIIRNWRTVKIATTKAQRKLFFSLRSAKKRIGWLNREEVESVAESLGVKPSDVVEMEKRIGSCDVAFDGYTDDDADDAYVPAHHLADQRDDPGQQLEHEQYNTHSHAALAKAVAILDARSRDIIAARWLKDDKKTLQELAEKYNVSAERIRQIENNAMKKLRQSIVAA